MIGPHFGSARATVPAPILPAPYGAAELRALAPRHTAQALAVASFVYVGLFGSLALLHRTSAAQPTPHGRIIFDHFPPPSREHSAVPAARQVVPSKLTTGTPTPVPDAQAPLETTLPANDRPAIAVEAPGEGPSDGTFEGTVVGPVAPVAPMEPPPLVPEPTVPTALERAPVPEVLEIAAVMPQVLDAITPVYPPLARQAGVEGRVILRVRVSKDGRAHAVSIVRSDHELLDEAAREAVSRWRFRPGMQDGQPVDVWMTIPIRFRIRERP